MNTHDEVMKHFGTAGLPDSSSDINNTKGARVASGEPSTLPSLFAGEYSPPPSNLPESVSAADILRQNEARAGNIGPGDRSPLAGTSVEGSDND